ncbi:MAG: hypothetical protein HQ472_11250 [Ignavibacteria bacterium]|nr:hypothetical protein [Ignavibacteria bacterium]
MYVVASTTYKLSGVLIFTRATNTGILIKFNNGGTVIYAYMRNTATPAGAHTSTGGTNVTIDLNAAGNTNAWTVDGTIITPSSITADFELEFNKSGGSTNPTLEIGSYIMLTKLN